MYIERERERDLFYYYLGRELLQKTCLMPAGCGRGNKKMKIFMAISQLQGFPLWRPNIIFYLRQVFSCSNAMASQLK